MLIQRLLAAFGWGTLFWLLASMAQAQSFPVIPEFQLYQSVGTRGSIYTTGAAGLAIHLFDESGGDPGLYLQLLVLRSPKSALGFESRIGGLKPLEDGAGYEIGLHNRWGQVPGKAASLTYRHLEWKSVMVDGVAGYSAKAEVLHMGWSWTSWDANAVVWLLGLDLTSLKLPSNSGGEAQLALGFRTGF
ncbi:MAG: hypothetical protein CL911_01720 [Deltaproteobacteria bacterium]|nr:hypothetical protein [Deltaproteobacteria bacterium]